MSTRLAAWLAAQMQQGRIGRNELSRATGLGVGTLTRILRHDHIPGPEVITTLAEFFGVDRDTVLELAGIVTLSDLPAELPPEVRDLARRLYRLSPHHRQAILNQIDGILKFVEELEDEGGALPAPRPDQ